MRMRAGAYKLLVASTKREQILDAAKSLLTCNARIKAYMTEAHRRKEEQDVPEKLQRRSDMVLYTKIMWWETVMPFSEMFLSLIGLQIYRMECLAGAKLP